MKWSAPAINPKDVHIVVVDDEPIIQETIASYLKNEGYKVSTTDGATGLRRLMDRGQFDLVLLDIRLADGDGLSLMRDLHANSDIPVILVTSKSEETDRVIGLELGADDYVTKPFSPRELLARVHTVLRRVRRAPEETRSRAVRRFAGWSLHTEERWLKAPDGSTVRLTHAEFNLLSALVSHPGRVMSRNDLVETIGDRQWYPSDRTIDVLIGRLRRKIEPDPARPSMIMTEYAIGYVFAERVA